MKILKITIAILAVIMIIIFGGGLFLPNSYSVSRSTFIKASDSVIYQNIANFNEFYKWNPWVKIEPTAKVNISGPAGQPGHLYTWKGKTTGAGEMKLIKAEVNKNINIDMLFKEPFEDIAKISFNIQPVANGNKVDWVMSGNHNIISKWLCVFKSMDEMVGKDFDSGLSALKAKSESTL